MAIPTRSPVGKIQQLYAANNKSLYTRISPYTENSGLLSFGPRQPYVTSNPNQGRSGINAIRRFDSRVFPIGSSLLDTQRVAKFMVSGNGIIFLAKQILLQKSQPFNETRIYNPLSPLLAVSTRINPFSDKNPLRFIDTTGGALGSLSSLVGISINNKPAAPKGTVGQGAMPNGSAANSKGLLRAQTAIGGYNRLTNVAGGKKGLLDSLKSLPKSLFGGFGAQKQPVNASFRADEGGYGIQLSSDSKFDYYDKNGAIVKWGKDYFMRFEAGKNNGNAKENIKKKGEKSIAAADKLVTIFSRKVPKTSEYFDSQLGHDLKTTSDGYIRYGDNLGHLRAESENLPFKFSDILSIYEIYTNAALVDKVRSDSKFTEKNKKSIKDIEDSLNRVIKSIKNAGYDYVGGYDIGMKQFSNGRYIGLDEITYNTKHTEHTGLGPENYIGSYGKSVKDNPHHIDSVKGFAGHARSDTVNTLTILSKNSGESILTEDPANYGARKFDPYTEDQIAFFFHDLVNDRYIPFRCTVKGINEALTANWSDVSYIGRADKLYNYTGFGRELSFNFTVVAMSVKELLPMWTRINYLAGLVKPSKYTESNYDVEKNTDKSKNIMQNSSFIVPPLVAVTIGDLYKEQPFILKTVGIQIPEGALWETVSENRSGDKDWNYLNSKIVYPDSNTLGKFAQFPRECEISINGSLLEKERPMVGRNNFGGVSDGGKFSSNLTRV
jgi:hypothetical protein